MIMTYNSFDYWNKIVNLNKTLKSRIFESEPITDKTVYLHYVIFNKRSGVESVWTPIPNARMLLGYIQYCFMPEAFYKWIEGRDKVVTIIPHMTVDEIILRAKKCGKLTKKEVSDVEKQISLIKNMWDFPSNKLMTELKKFGREFNKTWYGDSAGFLYINVFGNAVELGEFIANTNRQTSFDTTFEEKIGMSEEEWLKLCSEINKDKEKAEKFKRILIRELSEIV
ncbi:hypothetical protein CPJCM30710_12100 [Clostridium polyendosporum]|uniref:Uncharacterized protein n=1 Tax=Clostridium polyendosporum TaxID=69208 RepID=A0A919VDY7_9CLOT|nr:hypothetical protein [Clostridium polyendosporum]GIM28544.1 hypothetical protein CPJCM30710_12100 [Clostridium polyendosporum]